MNLREIYRASELLRLLSVLVILVMTTGCWDRKEMDDLALVMASGVDLMEDGQIEVTLQIALPSGMPSTLKAGGGGQKPVVVVSAKGKDSLEAIDRLQQQMSRFIYFGHREVFIIGEHYAKQGVNQVLDMFSRFPESRYNSYVLTAYGSSAKEILNQMYPLELIPGLGISKIEAEKNSFSIKMDGFLNALSTQGISPVTAAIRIMNKDRDKETFAIDHAAVYAGNKLTGFLPQDELELLRWWIGENNRMSFTIQATPEDEKYNGTISVQTLKSSVNVSTAIQSEIPEVTVSFHTTVRVVANDSRLDFNSVDDKKTIEKMFSDQLAARFESMVSHLQKEEKSDIFGIGKEVHIEHPYYWKKTKDKWNDIFPDVPVSIKVDVDMERMGKTQGRSYLRE
ncbi:Ger(x)C family spore germination protein [Paenibacillus sp. sgz5001063]|uniref:Ger(x)C family spore germination protein n=1 Tax=Paenibacillus sp. sgz5001063 TaxID=3242474 RepID=UPI0036D2FBEA